MTEIPLILKLKKHTHQEIAKAQDLIIKSLYEVFERAVLHGGTSIWRCYKGNRFSEDIDVYIPRNLDKIKTLFSLLEKRGFIIQKRKTGQNSLYSKLKIGNTIVRFEALFREIKGEIKEYEKADGMLTIVYTLSPEDLIKEKVETYIKRLKIRDIYDIFFLLRHVKDKKLIRLWLAKLITNFKKPVDEKELKTLIIEGITPSTEDMLLYVKRI